MPNLELIDTLINMYKPGGDGYEKVIKYGSWGFQACAYGALYDMGKVPEYKKLGDEHIAVANALGVSDDMGHRLVYDPVEKVSGIDKCELAVKILEEMRDEA